MTWLTCSYPQIRMKPNSCDPQVSNLYAAHHHCIPTDRQQWPGETEAPAVDQVAQHVQQYEKQKKGLAPPYVYGLVSQLLTVSLDPFDQEEGCRKYTQQGTLQFYLWDHWQDMRKWDWSEWHPFHLYWRTPSMKHSDAIRLNLRNKTI